MTALGWTFMTTVWAVLTGMTVWCFKLILMPDAKPNEAHLPPSGRM